jgi:zinc/manganese transport system substrate-binding protein
MEDYGLYYKEMNKTSLVWVLFVIVVIAGFFAIKLGHHSSPASSVPTGVLHVVAAENFWGSLVSQIGGSRVQVLNVVSDPNADPHEYESNATDARAVATANYIIENGAGYDSWMDKLVGAGSEPNRKVLNVAILLGKKEGDNPHFWYSPAYVNLAIAKMEQDLIALDPANDSYYEAQYEMLQASLVQYQNRITTMSQQFGGTKVAATEDIFTYLADAAGLDLVSPPAFIQAVAEGNDPPASSIVEFENQLKGGGVQMLVYNEQTVTPLTENMKKLAADQGIPVVGVTETIQPPDVSFEDWMNAELIGLQNALNAKTLGQ